MNLNINASSGGMYNNLVNSQNQMSKSMQRISSGLRINSASDDPSGLAISEKMRTQIRGLTQANRNAQDGISLLKTAEAGLEAGQNILLEMTELAVQASSETIGDEERGVIQKQVTDLLDELDKLAEKTSFNGRSLLDGSLDIKLAIDGNGGSKAVAIGSVSTAVLGSDVAKLSTFKAGGANETLDQETALVLQKAIEGAVKGISSERSSIGAKQNSLERTIRLNSVTSENLQAADSRIRDVDVAKEMMNMMKHQIIAETSQAMMAQNQQNAYRVLELVR